MIIKIKPGFKGQHNLLFRIAARVKSYFSKPWKAYQKVPVIINNYNRLDYLKQQISWLEKAGMRNIYIIDNASSYPPLLDYYKTCPYTIFKLTKNVGHTALWHTHIYLWFKNQHYILTDPDVVPIEECPLDAVEHFYNLLERYPEITKVGFGLKIDDLPNHYERKQEVIDWEEKYWQKQVEKNVYKANIDTTFALYKPNTQYHQWNTSLRTGDPYIARHMPWYEHPTLLSNEDLYFRKIKTKISSWYKDGEYCG